MEEEIKEKPQIDDNAIRMAVTLVVDEKQKEYEDKLKEVTESQENIKIENVSIKKENQQDVDEAGQRG